MGTINLKNIVGKDFQDLVPKVLSDKPPFRHLWLAGGRGSLKSSFASVCVLLRLLKFSNTHAVCIRKYDGHLRDSVFNQMLWAIAACGLSDSFIIRRAPLSLTHKQTGQVIYFKGMDDPLKLKSFRTPFGTVGTIWFEELEQYSGMEEIRNVFQSLGRGQSESLLAIYSYNPPISVYSWVNQEAITHRDDRLIHKSSYLHAPAAWLGQSFIFEAEQLKKNNLTAYRHEYLGEVTGTGGNVFNNIEEREITNSEIESMEYFYNGLDWGFAVDPLAFIRCSYDRKYKILYIVDEIYGTHIFNTQLMQMLQEKEYYTIIADCAEKKSIDELWVAGFNIYGAKKPPGSIAFGIKFLQDLYKIVVDKKRTPNAYREFLLYEYEKDKGGDYKSIYPDKNNHCIDAVRYALNDVMIY